MTASTPQNLFTARFPLRSGFFVTCAAMALAASPAERAHATPDGAFQGPITSHTGGITRNVTGPTTETIIVASPNATINWSPVGELGTSGPIDFLPAGHVATFTNNPRDAADFTVLNRIVPTSPNRPIALNGTVITQLQDLSGNVSTGGNVWFYSPGGILVGATAVFEVGSLLLTANDPISFTASSGAFSGQFVRGDSNAAVDIAAGAQISATASNSYVAIVAPGIEHDGAIHVNGSAAFVAAQQATLTFNQGLFDISVDVGTGDLNGIVHRGTTGGPASSGDGGAHGIYMVAVPKNQALTMLLSGNIGFAPAVSAEVQNGEIVLRAASTTGAPANIAIGAGSYSSDLSAQATGDISVIANASSIAFSGDVDLVSISSPRTGDIVVGAAHGGSLTIGGDLTANNSNPAQSSETLLFASSGGTVEIAGGAVLTSVSSPTGPAAWAGISANDATIAIGGEAQVSVSRAASSGAGAPAGRIELDAVNGGSITTRGLTLTADGTGQDNDGGGDGSGGDGYGGSISVATTDRGSIMVDGKFVASAAGIGGDISGAGVAGGSGYGGSVSVMAEGGSLSVSGDLTLSSDGIGGSLADAGSGGPQAGGSARGGIVILTTAGNGSILVDGATSLSASATGGSAQIGGDAFGGWTQLFAGGGMIDLGAAGVLAANAIAGTGDSDGVAEGGFSAIYAWDGIVTAGELALSATGQSGGTVQLDLYGSTLSADSLTLDASGIDDGGDIWLYVGSSNDLSSSFATDAFAANADGGTTAGTARLSFSGDSSAALGVAQVSAQSSTQGTGAIWIDLGSGAVENLELAPASEGAAHRTAQSLDLSTSGTVQLTSHDGAGLAIAEGLTALAGSSILLIDGGNGALIEANQIDLRAETIVSEVALQADVVEIAAADSFTVADVDAAISAAFEAGATANFLGLVSAPQITVTSADIHIGDGGQLGEAGVTNLLQIAAVSTGAAVLIGDDDEQQAQAATAASLQYHLSQAEADRIEASSIEFAAIGAGASSAPDIVLHNLEIGGSQTPGGGVNSIELTTDGSIFVLGQVLYGDAGASDSLSILAGDKIIVDTSAGGFIAMFSGPDGAETPSGNLHLSASDLWVGSSSLIGNLQADPNFAGRDEALLANPAAFNAVGHLAAGGMSIEAGNSFFLQNSGSASDFAGITVGGGGLSIITGQQPATVIAFGRGLGTGGAITGVDFFNNVDFSFAQSSYTDDSRFNNISINLGPPPPETLKITFGGHGGILGGIEVGLGGSEDSGESIDWADEAGEGGIPLTRALRDGSAFSAGDLLDEAVTSGGDSNLWIDDEEEDNGEEAPNLGE